tara:strand:+ start:1191 stop:2141 length:951 start_codon:yes stop_codon:yes gene_type:complete
MNVLITGAAGFIGSNVCKEFLKQGWNIYGLDNFDDFYDTKLKKERISELDKHKNFFFFNIDICNIKNLKVKNFDLMINLAAQAGVRLPQDLHFKYNHSNVDGFKHFLDFSNDINCHNLLYASSSSVYSSNGQIPYQENQKLYKPSSKYGETKLENERIAENFALETNSKIIGLRFFTVYGPIGRPDMAYYNFTKRILRNEEIILFNNGKTSRDMTYIDDIVEGILLAAKHLEKEEIIHEIFNLGNEKPIRTHRLVSEIEKEFKKSALIKYISEQNEVKITKADCTKAKSVLGYSPKTPFKKGIKRFFNWFRKYYGV